MKHFYSLIKEDPVWSKVLSFSLILFFMRLADGIISFWAPNLIQNALSSPVLMGLIISVQSVVGLIADLLFPHLLKKAGVRRLLFLAFITIGITALSLSEAAVTPFILLFLVTMIVWGVYYELISFANHQFVSSVVPLQMRSGVWGVLGTFHNLAYFLGPLAAAWLLLQGNFPTIAAVFIVLLVAFIIFFLGDKSKHEGELEVDVKDLNPVGEMRHWWALIEHTWPAIVLSLFLGFIDATFWTTGAVWTEKLSKITPLGSLFLAFYLLPPLFMGFIVAKWGIYRGKKKMAEKFLVVGGLLLVGLAFSGDIFWQLLMVFGSSMALAVATPMSDGVYSDLMARLGKEKKHMIGLTSSTINISYIVWPVIAGLISLQLGERVTFAITGGLAALVAFILLFITPRKLRLPETQIQKWQD